MSVVTAEYLFGYKMFNVSTVKYIFSHFKTPEGTELWIRIDLIESIKANDNNSSIIYYNNKQHTVQGQASTIIKKISDESKKIST